MEDAHIAKFNIDTDTHIFGVFDGHGGNQNSRISLTSQIRTRSCQVCDSSLYWGIVEKCFI